jgi:ABC-type multidrug transport system ATPase subunit
MPSELVLLNSCEGFVLTNILPSADRVLDMCGLREFADAAVGSLGVEQRKRTTIGVELAAKVRH